MIINGFGGDGRIQGESVLLQTVTGTVRGTYTDGTLATAPMTWGTFSTTGVNSSSTSNINVPPPNTFFGLGYKGIQYMPSVTSTSITSGNFAVVFKSDNNQSITTSATYVCGIAFYIRMFNTSFYLIGTGTFKVSASEIPTSYSRWGGHLVSYSSLSWTLVSYVTGSQSNLNSMLSDGNKGDTDGETFFYNGYNKQGTVYWRAYDGYTPINTFSPIFDCSMRGGAQNSASGLTTISSSNGGATFRPSYSIYNSSGATSTLTPTNPGAINLRVDIYGIN